MASDSALHETRTNAEHSETAADFRVTNESEEWRPVTIERIAHLYEVSNQGRVRSYRSGAARLLTPQLSGDGYWRIGLWDGELQTKYPVHRLVALAFLADTKNALHRQVAHLDGSRIWTARARTIGWATLSGLAMLRTCRTSDGTGRS